MELEKMDMEFSMEFYHKNKVYHGINLELIKDDGTLIRVFGDEELGFAIKEQKKNSFFIFIKEFYGNGKLHEKGMRLAGCKIDKWIECDDNGNCQTIDYEKNRGKFTYNDVLKFLEKKGYINIKKGTQKGMFYLGYSYENQEWIVEASPDKLLFITYFLDGNTGKIKRQEQRILQG